MRAVASSVPKFRLWLARPSRRLPIEPPPGMLNTDASVMVWQRAQLAPVLLPRVMSMVPVPALSLATMPITALALTSLTVVAGSLRSGARAGERSVLSSAAMAASVAASSASLSIIRPSCRALIGVTPAAIMPC